MNILGNSIKELRKSKKMTQKQLSELTGLKQNTISNHENGNRSLDECDIRVYAKALGVEPQQLFDMRKSETSNITPLPSSQPEIAQIYNALSQDSKTKLLKYAKLLQEADNIEYYEVIATTKLSAGVGYAFNEDDQEKVYVENKPPYYEIASFINGDSMEPKYHSGDIVYLVDKGLSTYNGQVCAVSYQDRTYLKRVFTEKGRLRLESINTRYKDIYIDFPPTDGDYLRIYEVIGTDSTVTL